MWLDPKFSLRNCSIGRAIGWQTLVCLWHICTEQTPWNAQHIDVYRANLQQQYTRCHWCFPALYEQRIHHHESCLSSIQLWHTDLSRRIVPKHRRLMSKFTDIWARIFSLSFQSVFQHSQGREVRNQKEIQYMRLRPQIILISFYMCWNTGPCVRRICVNLNLPASGRLCFIHMAVYSTTPSTTLKRLALHTEFGNQLALLCDWSMMSSEVRKCISKCPPSDEQWAMAPWVGRTRPLLCTRLCVRTATRRDARTMYVDLGGVQYVATREYT